MLHMFVCCCVFVVCSLRVLHFFNNMSGNGGAKAISAVLRASPLLEDFRFASTRVGKEGGEAFAEGLKGLTGLKRLDLSDNTFGRQVGILLGKSLEDKRQLEVVNLSDTSELAAVVYDCVMRWLREWLLLLLCVRH